MKKQFTILLCTLFSILISSNFSSAQLFINEFMASNSSGISDEMGQFEDWIEIYNAGPADIDLAGYYISDNALDPLLWQIPATNTNLTTVPTGGFLILWADKDILDGANHLNIKLGSGGEDIVLTHPNGSTVIDQYTFAAQVSDVSFGRISDGGTDWDFFAQPTPGATNDTPPGAPQVFPPVASISGGFYSGSVQVGLSTITQGATIYYTLDGSHPTESDDEYTGPITIDENTPLRARAYLDPLVPSFIKTETYLFDIDHTFPVVAYSADPEEMFGSNGMYTLYDEDIEINVNAELYETDGTQGFNQVLESEINGSGSASAAQKSLALKAKSSLGSATIDYQVFPLSTRDKYRSLMIRNSGQDWNKTMFRDAMATSLIWDVNDINGNQQTILKPEIHGEAYRPTITYINGEYWGILNLRERSDKRYIRTHFGLDDNEIDFLENHDEVKNGDLVAWEELTDFLEDNDLVSENDFKFVADRIELDHYIDYIVFNLYIDASDWPGNNERRFRKRAAGEKWRWLTYDLDFSFGLSVEGQPWNSGYNNANSLERLLTLNGYSWPNPDYSTLLFRRLIENEGWRTRFVNRMADQLNILFEDDRVVGRIDDFKTEYAPEMQGHADRWSGGYISWDNNVQKLRNFANGRADNVRDHFISEIDDINGISDITIQLNNAALGEVDLNTISVHSGNAPFTGIYFEGVDIPVTAHPNRGYVLENWSGDLSGDDPNESANINSNTNITANFGPGSTASDPIVINEINYNSVDGLSSDDWMELYNPNNFSVDISGWYFEDESGRFFGLPANTILPADSYLVLVETAEKFSSIYPQVNNYLGNFGGEIRGFGLSNKGELITLKNAAGDLIDAVEYDDKAPWPVEADGSGPTLQLIDPALDNALASSWEAIPATPGALNGTNTGQNQTINFTPIPDQLATNPPFQINATASSGLPVSFTILSGPATISGNTITLNGTTGVVTVQASQAGNVAWNPAPNVTQSFNVNPDIPSGDYCDARSDAPWHEWIAGVQLNDLNNTSAKNKYTDFTNQVATITGGATYDITLTTGYSYTTYDEYFRVWIDYNQNNVFEEPSEIAYSGIVTGVPNGSSSGSITGSINVPGNASQGITRMRVSMRRGAYAPPCGVFPEGEVEDYSVLIDEGSGTVINLNNCSDDIEETANPGENSRVVSWIAPSASTTCNPNTVTLNQTSGPSSGSSFNAGTTTTIVYTASDQCGNQQTCSFTVTVNPPNNGSINLNCPGNISIFSDPGQSGANVSWTEPSGSTTCPNGGLNINQIDGAPNGTFFSEGTHTIVYIADDACGNGASCTFSITVVPDNTNAEYCVSRGNAPWHDYIGAVQFNTINNPSGKSKYSDFTNITTDVIPEATYDIILTTAYSWTTYEEHWKVWIDYNQNNIFEEPSEVAYYGILSPPPNGTDNGYLNGLITIPADASSGSTRMRVAMKRNGEPGPCEEFPYGEVEDYSVNISGSFNGGNPQGFIRALTDVELFPNPTSSNLTLILKHNMDIEQIEVFNLASKRVLQLNGIEGEEIYTFDVGSWLEGMYFMHLKLTDGRRVSKRFIVQGNY